jgi:hypothetical protein
MLLKSDDGAEFELALIEDRFPELQDDAADSNYTTITFRVATPDESWEETAPCMNLFELKNLEEWLQAVARGTPEEAELELLEPELKFSVAGDTGDQVTLRIGFHLEDRPEEFSVDSPTDEADFVDIRTSRPKIAAAAAELHHDLTAAATVHPSTQAAAEEDSGIIGIPDEALGLIDEDSPAADETDPNRKY